jgi:hypothetical protein
MRVPRFAVGLAVAWAALVEASGTLAGSHEACMSAATNAEALFAEAQAYYNQCLAADPAPGLSDEEIEAVYGLACAPARAFCEQHASWDLIAQCDGLLQSGALGEAEMAEAEQALQVLRSFTEVACPPQ